VNRRIEEHYRMLLRDHGDSHLAAQYSSRESQMRRFASLTRVGDVTGRSVLDFGCGTATLWEYFSSCSTLPTLYWGIDVVEDFLEVAARNCPSGRFTTPEGLGDERFDFVFVSGVFNNRRAGNRRFWQSTVAELFERTDIGLAFNLMSTYVDYRDDALFYERPERVFAFVKENLTPYVTLHHDYLAKEGSVPFEMTVLAYREPVELWLP
jgi:SAM-dependent methyltransferase